MSLVYFVLESLDSVCHKFCPLSCLPFINHVCHSQTYQSTCHLASHYMTTQKQAPKAQHILNYYSEKEQAISLAEDNKLISHLFPKKAQIKSLLLILSRSYLFFITMKMLIAETPAQIHLKIPRVFQTLFSTCALRNPIISEEDRLHMGFAHGHFLSWQVQNLY